MYILQIKSFKHSGLKNCKNQGTFVSLLTPISLMKAYITIGSNLGVKLWQLADKLFDKHMVKDTGASELFVNSLWDILFRGLMQLSTIFLPPLP